MAYSTAADTLVPIEAPKAHPLSGSFRKNMALPVHRWFRYSAGFSAAWAEQEIKARKGKGSVRVCDPFAGSGTTLIAAQRVGADARGVESHPFVARVAKAKLRWGADIGAFTARAERVVKLAGQGALPDPLPDLLAKIFEPEKLRRLLGLREALLSVSEHDEIDELLWLVLVAILRACSPAGTAQWQYVLPNKTKSRVADPVNAFRAQVAQMATDMLFMQALPGVGDAKVKVADARETAGAPDGWADLVVTSPPYPNNFDYADATRIEMTFLGEIASWGDLQGTVRKHLIRSCSQHMVRYDATAPLEDALLDPIGEELRDTYDQLDAVRREKGGRKAYHSMVVAYFHDLAACWHSLRRAVAEGGEVLFVIGDSAPYGVHLPVERWLGELALAAGFEDYTFTKLRDRNTSPLWKSRKHDVRLHEGILRVTG
jgi:hypothetical protein